MYYGCAAPLLWAIIYASRTLRPRQPYELVEAGNSQELERRLQRGYDPDTLVPVKGKQGKVGGNCSLLYYSVVTNQRLILEILLSYHADPNLASKAEHTTPLLAAVRLQRTGLPEILLKYRADPNLPDIFGNTPLIEAAVAGHSADCQLLLEFGANPNAATFKTGATPLIAAARQGHTAEVRLLLEHGADPNVASFQGGTALMDAAYNDYPEICELLLEHGADLAAQIAAENIAGSTALLQCAMHNRLRPARVLLDAGADIDAPWSQNGATALHIAVTNCHDKFVELLLRRGANPNLLNASDTPPLQLALWKDWGEPVAISRIVTALLDKGADPNQHGHGGRTALHTLLWDKPGDLAQLRERVALLIKHGADVNAHVADPAAETPPLSPLIMAAAWGDVPTAQLLLDAGADAGYFPPWQGGYTRSALDMAVQENQPEMLRLLLARGAQLNPTGSKDCAALTYCIGENRVDMARMLLEAGANPSSLVHSGPQGDMQFPTIAWAALHDKPGMVQLLQQFGARLDERTNWGATLLHVAAHQEALASIAYLLEQGADIEATDDEGLRPLHEAAKTGSAGAVELLLKHGADPNSRGSFGRQPLDLLGYNQDNIDAKIFKRIEQALTKAGAKLSASYT